MKKKGERKRIEKSNVSKKIGKKESLRSFYRAFLYTCEVPALDSYSEV